MRGEKEKTSEEVVRVRSNNGYAGVVAVRDYRPGEQLLSLEGHIIERPSRYSIQVAVDRHLEPNEAAGGDSAEPSPWKFLNHSCEPNLEIDLDSRRFVARRSIAAAEELTFNYLTTEWDMATPFECHCGSAGCFGTIAGFKHLSEQERERLLDAAAPHIRMLHSAFRVPPS